MAKILVTGSADGIGRQTALMLADAGHQVFLHARNDVRAEAALAAVPAAEAVLVGDLASLEQTRVLAKSAADHGPFETVVHNAGIADSGSRRRTLTEDGLERVFQVNVLAPYLLTALMPLPHRLVYLTSGMASGGTIDLTDLQRERRPWDGTGAYCDSKLADIALAFAVARRQPEVCSNAVCPGWVRSRMGGPSAPTDLRTGAATQVWLAGSDEPAARVTGRYFRHMRLLEPPEPTLSVSLQEGLLTACAELTGMAMH
ncbi:SDR family NAD(P)-dependent oxidoreductase [Micromonospora sp. NPDC006766]|uniref:SDR family NAD(P)-dependent oxidoreductase n=1 Tax=Micromonospora sp. NPDC006766 TaxID=3154778 RepID=UPI0033E64B94